MRFLKILRLRLRSILWPSAIERELDDELHFHLERQTEEYVSRGVAVDEARRLARRDVGAVERWKDDCRDVRRVPRFEELVKDLRLAIRTWRRQKGVAALAVATLSTGIGANVAMFDLVDTLMFRPPAHVHEPDRLVRLPEVENYVEFATASRGARTVDLAAYVRRELSLGLGDAAEAVSAECVSTGFFELLGARPMIGRAFRRTAPEELVVVLSYGLWARRFGARPDVVGQAVHLDARSFVVAGVAPRSFRGLRTDSVDVWILVTAAPELCSFTGRNQLATADGSWLETVGRLRGDETVWSADADLDRLLSPEDRFDRSLRSSPGSLVEPLMLSRRERLSSQNQLAWWLAGGAVAVLLIASANVGGLLSIRAVDRRREFAVRLQLGASRGRLVRQFVAEHVVLATVCAVAAVAVAVWMQRVLGGFFPYGAEEDSLAGRVFVATAVTTLVAGTLSALPAVLQLRRADATVLAQTSRSADHARSAFRSGLLVVQVGLALVLVICAGLFVRSVVNRERTQGFDVDRVVVAAMDLARAGYEGRSAAFDVFERAAERLRRHPDIEAVALSSGSLLGSGGFSVISLLRASPDARPMTGRVLYVSPDYFRALGTPIVSGRVFGPEDVVGSESVVVLDRSTADALWPGREAVGECVYLPACARVVGLVEPRQPGHKAPGGLGEVFRSAAQAGEHYRPQMLVIRTRDDGASAVGTIAALIRGTADDLPALTVRTLEDLADEQNRSWRMGRTVFGGFGVMAILLASIGLYGVLAFQARQRTAEIGVRMALGATRRDILRLVVRQGFGLLAFGWLLGLTLTLVVVGHLEALLFEVSPTDGGTFAIASAVIIAAGLSGCLFPALHAARVDPVVALRQE